ncbi:unnamed protein product [Rodentolepis nana]|uniref:MafI family immunity protein n=1 Tax=Rodentolepis nana TaxID=102285 RepID=A0A0R3TQU6_RODNA|nr:unnamed protein product [Rodentolepis nana]
MAELILSQASALGYDISERIECVDSKVDDFELVNKSNFEQKYSEHVDFSAFLFDLTKVNDMSVKDILVGLSSIVSSSSDFTISIQKRQHIRELVLRTIKNFESITSNNHDFCQQLEDLCTTLSS